MCIAILTKENEVIDETTLKNCHSNNKDGCGLAYVLNGELVIKKTLDLKEFLNWYDIANQEALESPKLIHFRKQSKGAISLENCHPFRISKDLCFIHNGTIYNKNLIVTKDESDTSTLNSDILQGLPEGWYYSDACLTLIESFIGNNNKLIVLSSDMSYTIINEASGHWNKDKTIWYSNYSYFPNTPSTQKYKPSQAQIEGKKQTGVYYGLGNHIYPGSQDDWICGECSRWNGHYRNVCTCGKGYKALGTRANPTRTCPKCWGNNPIDAKSCNFCKHPFVSTGECSFCGRETTIVFETDWCMNRIKLCSRCLKVLEAESDVYFPKALLTKDLVVA